MNVSGNAAAAGKAIQHSATCCRQRLNVSPPGHGKSLLGGLFHEGDFEKDMGFLLLKVHRGGERGTEAAAAAGGGGGDGGGEELWGRKDPDLVNDDEGCHAFALWARLHLDGSGHGKIAPRKLSSKIPSGQRFCVD